MVAGHLLGQLPAAACLSGRQVVLEHDEVPDQSQKPARRADAFQHHLELGQLWIGQACSGDGAPGLEPLPPGSERADARLQAVGDHQGRVHGKQRRQLGLVGLELPPGGPDRGVLVGRVLELDDPERQAVDEQHHVGAARVPVLADGELVDRQEIVVGGIVEVDDPHLGSPDDAYLLRQAIGRSVLHRHAVHQHPVEGPVACFEG